MHLVKDTARLKVAIAKGLPFFYTACDSAEPISEMTTEISRVDCPGCRASIPTPVVPSVDLESEVSGFDDLGDLDDDLDLLDALIPNEPEAAPHSSPKVPPDSPSEPSTPDPFEALAPMIEMVLDGFNPEYPDLQRWTLAADDDEILGSHGVDLRELLSPEETDFVIKLISLSELAGIEGLATRVLAVLHRALDRFAEARLLYDDVALQLSQLQAETETRSGTTATHSGTTAKPSSESGQRESSSASGQDEVEDPSLAMEAEAEPDSTKKSSPEVIREDAATGDDTGSEPESTEEPEPAEE